MRHALPDLLRRQSQPLANGHRHGRRIDHVVPRRGNVQRINTAGRGHGAGQALHAVGDDVRDPDGAVLSPATEDGLEGQLQPRQQSIVAVEYCQPAGLQMLRKISLLARRVP